MNDSIRNKLRCDAINLFKAGIEAATPQKIFPKKINLENEILSVSDINNIHSSFNLKDYRKLFVIGSGKAGAAMVKELEVIFGNRISEGLIVTKYGFINELAKIKIIGAAHPLPDFSGMNASKEVIGLCNRADENDLVINLLSGGASALLPFPSGNISLEEKILTTKLLLESGASIKEINTIRKHISAIKGGRLAEYIYPATVINIIISDVIGDDLEIIGSGMTVPDSSTFNDCGQILNKYSLSYSLPDSVLQYINNGINGLVEETPKPGNPVFDKVHSSIVCNNLAALSTIKSLAQLKGYETIIVTDSLDGEARILGEKIVDSLKQHSSNKKKPLCVLYGGESRVTIKGNGKGGRNQELCLSASIQLEGKENVVFLSGGTDGIDGPTEAAGAICDGQTVHRAGLLGMDPQNYLNDNNSFIYFNQLNDLIFTGPTNTNVMDIQIVLLNR